jgi:hypothetical protein
MGNLGDILLKLLSFALLSAYIFEFSSMLDYVVTKVVL